MPYVKKTTKRVYKKRTMRKAYKPKRRVSRLLSASTYPFPRTTTRKLKYVGSFGLDSATASALATHTFSCNGLYDPDITGTGHQPYGFDQLMALYNHYEVLSSKIKITIADNNASNSVGLICRVDANGNLNTSNLQLIMEQPDTKKVIFNPAEAHRTVLRHSWSQRKFFGKRKAGDEALCGTAGNNPAESSFYIIGLGSVDPNANAPNMYLTVEIDYVARFFEPLELSSS